MNTSESIIAVCGGVDIYTKGYVGASMWFRMAQQTRPSQDRHLLQRLGLSNKQRGAHFHY